MGGIEAFVHLKDKCVPEKLLLPGLTVGVFSWSQNDECPV